MPVLDTNVTRLVVMTRRGAPHHLYLGQPATLLREVEVTSFLPRHWALPLRVIMSNFSSRHVSDDLQCLMMEEGAKL